MAFVFNPFTGTLDHKLDIEGTSSELSGNIALNGNYISNDGGNEGISINDNGEVTFKSSIGLSLDGTTDYVDLGSLDLINIYDYSISAWFKTSEAAYGVIFNKTSEDGSGDDYIGWNLYINGDGKVEFLHRTGAGGVHIVTVTSDDVLSDGSWHHVVITADRDGNLLMYVDGDTTPDDTVDVSSRTTTINANTSGDDAHLLIGMESADLSDELGDFNGSIDEVAIFQNRILSTSNVTAFYNNGAPKDLAAEANLVGYWRFDEGSGSSVEDSSADYSNAGTLENGATWGAGAGGTAVTKLEINSNVINVRKNIALNDNYISNDGDNEGIKITNDGDVFIGGVNGSAVYQDGTVTIYNTQTGSVSLNEPSGGNESVRCGNITQLSGTAGINKFTVSSWSYHTTQTNGTIWSMIDWDDGQSGIDKISLTNYSGSMRAYVSKTTDGGSTTGYVQNETSKHQDNVWEHWAVVYDGSGGDNAARLKLYFNGALLGGANATYSGTVPATLPLIDHADDQFIMGDQNALKWEGQIGEVTLWSDALTTPNITTLYDGGHPYEPGGVNTAALIGYWKFAEADFDDGTNTTITNSANEITGAVSGTYDGTLQNDASYADAVGLFAATTVTSGNPGFTILRGNLTMNRGQFLTNNLSTNKGLSMNSSGAVEIEGSVGTGATCAGVLTLSTAEPTVRVGTVDQLGRIEFQAPKEALGGDALLVGASIHAEAEEDFAADNNSTALVFSTGTTSAPIERLRINQDGVVSMNGTIITTQLKIAYDADSFTTMAVADLSHLTITTAESGMILLDAGGDIRLDAAGGDITILQADLAIPIDKKVTFGDAGEYITGDNTDLTIVSSHDILLNAANIKLKPSNGNLYMLSGSVATVHIRPSGGTGAGAAITLKSLVNTDDYFDIDTTINGVTVISTVDDVGNEADLTFNIDGFIDINSATGEDITLDAGGDITLDADGDQVSMKFGGATGQIDFSNENSGDGIIRQMINAKDLVIQQFDGDEVARFTDGGDLKITNTVYFAAETANTIADGATGAIDWNVSQKQKLTITGTGITCNFTDPAGACNLLLRVTQGDGSDVVGTWDSDIKWAGGSAPTLSTGNGEIDILSFYWDGSKYYGVASLDFS